MCTGVERRGYHFTCIVVACVDDGVVAEARPLLAALFLYSSRLQLLCSAIPLFVLLCAYKFGLHYCNRRFCEHYFRFGSRDLTRL